MMKSSRPIRIAYMEDDKGLARLFQKRMHKHGYEVDVAHDGEQGLAMLDGRTYDFVAVDHKMPRRTGLEVIRTLASRGALPPTVMITGSANEGIAVEALKLGAIDYVIKDADLRYLDLLPHMIERALGSEDTVDDLYEPL
ncbi:MAG: response regulator [Desulfomonilaceae bacterium]|nr:response regulator [Desulfomonilaceae bacterium]